MDFGRKEERLRVLRLCAYVAAAVCGLGRGIRESSREIVGGIVMLLIFVLLPLIA